MPSYNKLIYYLYTESSQFMTIILTLSDVYLQCLRRGPEAVQKRILFRIYFDILTITHVIVQYNFQVRNLYKTIEKKKKKE